MPGSRHVVTPHGFRLYNVLKAYSIYRRDVGYCQGMASLAGLCLMYLEEEDAFWMLEILLRGYGDRIGLQGLYLTDMPLAWEFLHVYKLLLTQFCPKLAQHLDAEGVNVTSYAFRWLTTRFDNFPQGLYIRIFDIFLHEGMKIIYRVAIWLLQSRQKTLLKLRMEEITEILMMLADSPEMHKIDYVIEESLKIRVTNGLIKNFTKAYRNSKI